MYFNPIDFGERLCTVRKAAGMTQEELAEKLSVDRNHIGRIERGTRTCSIDLLVELSTVLGISTDYLLMGKPNVAMAKRDLLHTIEQLTQIVQDL